jgi:hypothetical protein
MNISEILQFDKLDTSKVRNSPSFDEGLYATWEGTFNNYHYDEAKPIPFDLPTKVFVAGGNTNIFAFKKLDEDESYSNMAPDMFLGLHQFYDGFKVDNVRVEPSLRGHQYGMKLYLAVAKYYNKPLYSGSQQTSASNNGIWKKLIEHYPNQVVGFDQKTKKDLRLKVTAKGPVVQNNRPIYKKVNDTEYRQEKHYNEGLKTRLLKLLP